MTRTPRADFWFAIFLTMLGIGIVAESWRMPRLEHLGVHPMSAPGLTPGLLGAVLAVLGLALLLRSLVEGRAATGGASGAGWGRLLVALALCLTYALALLGRAPFWMATALFVFAFVTAFTWREGSVLRMGATAAALALVTAASVTLLFERVFLVRLP